MDELKEKLCEILFSQSDYKKESSTHTLHEREFDNAAEDILAELESQLTASRTQNAELVGILGQIHNLSVEGQKIGKFKMWHLIEIESKSETALRSAGQQTEGE